MKIINIIYIILSFSLAYLMLTSKAFSNLNWLEKSFIFSIWIAVYFFFIAPLIKRFIFIK